MNFHLSPSDTLEIFNDEVTTFNGTSRDVYQDEQRLFVRSVMPLEAEVKPDDVIKGGVALRQYDDEVEIYPFIFRKVCANGQVAPGRSLKRSARITLQDAFSAEQEIRETIKTCADPSLLGSILEEVKQSPKDTYDYLATALPLVKKWLETKSPRLHRKIMRRFRRHEDASRFGLMNAVTDIARDLQDPQQRWDLEQLGGAIGVGAPLPAPKPPTRAKRNKINKRTARKRTAKERAKQAARV